MSALPSRFLRRGLVGAVVLLAVGVSAALAQQEIFVTNANSDSVTVYGRLANGNVMPRRILMGPATGLDSPSGIAVDEVNDELFVVNSVIPYSVRVFSRTANGNVAPLRTIVGDLTGLNSPRGLTLDVENNEFALVNRPGFTLLVFSRMANGDVEPVRAVSGVASQLSNPTGVAWDVDNNEILVANNGASLTVFAQSADGGTAVPLRKIFGDMTGFNSGPIGVAVDTVNDELAVTNPFFDQFNPSVLVFERTADGDAASSRQIYGAATGMMNPNGLAIDTVNNEILVASPGNNSVRVYERTADGDDAPLRVISGDATLINSPQFLAITTSPSATLDIDDNGLVEALTDGLLVLRRLFGFTGGALTNGAVAATCARCDAGDIATYIDGLGAVLDIDHDFELAALTDGLLVVRFLFSFTGTALTNGAVDVDCTDRCTAATILPYLQTLD